MYVYTYIYIKHTHTYIYSYSSVHFFFYFENSFHGSLTQPLIQQHEYILALFAQALLSFHCIFLYSPPSLASFFAPGTVLLLFHIWWVVSQDPILTTLTWEEISKPKGQACFQLDFFNVFIIPVAIWV